MTAALAVLAILLWGWVACFALWQKDAWLDDAFIALHVSANVLEQGSARYFPIADNPSLLASSPLRVLVLVPSLALSRIITGAPRSLEEARLAFFLAAVLTSMLAGLLFRGRGRVWLVGCIGAAMLALGTESALQMEGLALAWLVWAVVTDTRAKDAPSPGVLGLIAGLLLLTRPEFGVTASIVLGGLLAWRRPERVARFTVALGAVVGVWWIAGASLRVWPLPTTILTKVLSARGDLFQAGSFGSVWPARAGSMLAFGADERVLVWIIVLAIVAAVMAAGRRFLVASMVWALALIALWNAPGNYRWYHENMVIVLLVLAAAALLHARTRTGWSTARTATLAAALALFAMTSVGRDRRLPWGFSDAAARGSVYREVARHHVGQGRFVFAGDEPTYLHVTEIGMISWFSGGDVWLGDHYGLAQVGNLPVAWPRALRPVYPESVRRDYVDELEVVSRKARPQLTDVVLSGVEIDPASMQLERCGYRDPEGRFCVVRFFESTIDSLARRPARRVAAPRRSVP